MSMNRLCALTGAEFPLFAFSHCRDVVAAVSRSGGFGVLGATRFTPEQLEEELAWIDQNLKGFKGRASRDNWIDQAKILASGGTTEFADRVKKGDVYE